MAVDEDGQVHFTVLPGTLEKSAGYAPKTKIVGTE